MCFKPLHREQKVQTQSFKKAILTQVNSKKLKCCKDILLKPKISLSNKRSTVSFGNKQAKKFLMIIIKLMKIKRFLKKKYRT